MVLWKLRRQGMLMAYSHNLINLLVIVGALSYFTESCDLSLKYKANVKLKVRL